MAGAIVAENLVKTYGDVSALEDVSLDISEGSVFGLIGPNGAGKTTLVQSLVGTTTPDSGSIRLFDSTPTDVARNRIGYLPQSFSPPGRLTARELLEYYAGLYEEPRDTDTLLDTVALTESQERRYEQLSGGQQRRLCVATTLLGDPDLLFLDEPTTGIDPAGRRSLWRVIDTLRTGGATVVVTTHDMEEAATLSDQVGLLDAGQLVATGAPDALVAAHGGERVLDVDTTADPETLADSDFSIDRVDTGLRIHDVEPAQIGTIVTHLERAGVDFDGLTWCEPDLEDVYLRLTDQREDTAESFPAAEPDPVEGVQ